MRRLILGLDALAILRESRRTNDPDPAAVAVLAELAGVDGVSLGLRTDRRTGQERDLQVLRSIVRGQLQARVPPTPESLKVVAPIRPDAVVLVPERTEALGNETGFDLTLGPGSPGEAAAALREAGLPALVLVDPEREQVKAAHRMGFDGVVLTGSRLAAARLPETEAREVEALDDAVRLAGKLGLQAQVAHGLHLSSLRALHGLPPDVTIELGHAVCGRAMLVGIDRAIRDVGVALQQRG